MYVDIFDIPRGVTVITRKNISFGCTRAIKHFTVAFFIA